jgi:hypothetical protein
VIHLTVDLLPTDPRVFSAAIGGALLSVIAWHRASARSCHRPGLGQARAARQLAIPLRVERHHADAAF